MTRLLNQKLMLGITMVISSAAMLASCDKTESYNVTYYNGNQVLKVEEVKDGELATDWTPVVEGYTFDDWYGTPTFTHKFDFTQAITGDTEVFGKFISNEVVADTRDFYIVGSGTSPILLESNWGKVINDSMKLTKASDKNDYTITLDLYAGDQFQFAINTSWENQRGVGYLQGFKLDDEEIFKDPGSAYGNSSKRSNIEVKKSGNYTFTLTTYPDKDYYDVENANYTEEGKENFNLNDYDKITWVRNGDASDPVEAIVTYYIKGAGVTGWADVYNAHTRMTDNEGTHTLKIYLKENEEFLFTSTNTVGEKVTAGPEYLRASCLDEASKAYVDQNASYNMIAKASGYYTFTYVKETGVLSVAFEAGEMTPTDYYIDGTFGSEAAWSGYCFNPSYKLVKDADKDVYKIENVTMALNSEFIIQAFKEGSTERGEWGTESYNGLGSYNFTYLSNPGQNFSAVSSSNKNIKVLKEAAYNVTFDPYTQQITISRYGTFTTYDVYIKGGMNNWAFNFLPEWKLTQSTVDPTIYEITLNFEANWEVGLAYFNEGEKTGYGTWVGREKLGTSGDANDKFEVESGNLKCNTAGKYRVVYNQETDKIDFYAA